MAISTSTDADTPSTEKAKKIAIAAADSEGRFYEAINAVKGPSDIPRVVNAAEICSKELREIAKDLMQFKEVSGNQKCALWSAHATRQYEISGTDDINQAFERIPANILDSVISAISTQMTELQTSFAQIESSLNIDRLRPGPAGTVDEVFELRDEFVAWISTINEQGSTSSPIVALELSVSVRTPDKAYQPLFVQYVKWSGAAPTKAEIRKWVQFEPESDSVDFTPPKNSFSYTLPRNANKAEHDNPHP